MTRSGFASFAESVEAGNGITAGDSTLTIRNRNGDAFHILESEVRRTLELWHEKNAQIRDFISTHPERTTSDPWDYQEKPYRDVFLEPLFAAPEFAAVVALARSQTKPFMSLLSKYAGYSRGDRNCASTDRLLLDKKDLAAFR